MSVLVGGDGGNVATSLGLWPEHCTYLTSENATSDENGKNRLGLTKITFACQA